MKLPLNETEYRSVIQSYNNIFSTFSNDDSIPAFFEECIFKWGIQLGISKEDLRYIENNPETIRFIPPRDRKEALEQIYDLVYIIFLDEIIEDDELKVAMEYAKKLGFEPSIIGDLLKAMVTASHDTIRRSDIKYEVSDLEMV
jgi:hypothetical protein